MYLIPVKQNDSFVVREIDDLSWPDLEVLFEKHAISAPATFLPPELFLEQFVLDTTTKLQLPVVFGSVFQLPLLTKSLTVVDCDCLITTATVAPFLFKNLPPEVLTSLKALVLVDQAAESPAVDIPCPVYSITSPIS